MKLALGLLVTTAIASPSIAQVKRHPPGLRPEMVVTGRVGSYNGKSFTLITLKSGTYTIRILPSTIIKVPKLHGRYGLRNGAPVTAQGFVHQRTIDATKITVLERVINNSK